MNKEHKTAANLVMSFPYLLSIPLCCKVLGTSQDVQHFFLSEEMISLALAGSAIPSLSGKDVKFNSSNHTTDLMTIETDLSNLESKTFQ